MLAWLARRAQNRQQARGRMAEEVKAGAEAQVISEEQLRKAEEYVQQEEGAANRLAGWVGVAVTGIAVVMTLFHLYAAYDIVPTQELRYIHVAFVLLLSFLLFPLAARFRNHVQWFDVIPALAGIGIIVYALSGGDDFLDRAAVPDRRDFRRRGRRFSHADHHVHDLRRDPATFRRRQVFHRLLACGDGRQTVERR